MKYALKGALWGLVASVGMLVLFGLIKLGISTIGPLATVLALILISGPAAGFLICYEDQKFHVTHGLLK